MHRSIIALCLIITSIAAVGCIPPAASPAPATTTPPSTAPTSTPVTQNRPPLTAITAAPSGTINNSRAAFKWSGSDDSTPSNKLTYSTFLEGYDSGYAPFSPDTSKTYTNLPDGDYTFYVKAMDDYGNIEPEPVSARFTVKFVPVSPAAPPVNIGGMLLVPGLNVSRLAVSGATIYALDSFNSKLYRSDSMGMGWFDISNKVGAAAPWVDVAAAPDDPALVAVATNGGSEVYVSGDSGANFTPTSLSSVIGGGQFATCIAVSPDYGGPKHEIAVGTATGAAGGKVLVNTLTMFSGGWADISADADGWATPAIPGVDITAVEFSPSYAGDGVILAVASSAVKTYLYMGVRDLGGRTAVWNSSGGYPVELCQPGAGTPGTLLKYADISLPADYSGSNAYSRHAFVSWSKTHASQDVYHVVDAQAYRMQAPEPIASIAYYGTIGGGKLLAGAVKCKDVGGCCCAVQTYFTANAMSLCPACPMWQPSRKPPTGAGIARVAWSGDGKLAFAGTSGSNSAVSHSRDNGYTWNQ